MDELRKIMENYRGLLGSRKLQFQVDLGLGNLAKMFWWKEKIERVQKIEFKSRLTWTSRSPISTFAAISFRFALSGLSQSLYSSSSIAWSRADVRRLRRRASVALSIVGGRLRGSVSCECVMKAYDPLA